MVTNPLSLLLSKAGEWQITVHCASAMRGSGTSGQFAEAVFWPRRSTAWIEQATYSSISSISATRHIAFVLGARAMCSRRNRILRLLEEIFVAFSWVLYESLKQSSSAKYPLDLCKGDLEIWDAAAG
jgi:hypothetical protein